MKRIFIILVEAKEDGSMKGSKTVRYAFSKSLPVMFGYLFLGSAFGVMLQQAGYQPHRLCRIRSVSASFPAQQWGHAHHDRRHDAAHQQPPHFLRALLFGAL